MPIFIKKKNVYIKNKNFDKELFLFINIISIYININYKIYELFEILFKYCIKFKLSIIF